MGLAGPGRFSLIALFYPNQVRVSVRVILNKDAATLCVVNKGPLFSAPLFFSLLFSELPVGGT